MSPELVVFLVAISPIAELRGAIPLALTVYHFAWPKAFLISILGNLSFIIPVVWFLEVFSAFLMKKFSLVNKFFTWLFQRTQAKITASYKKYSRWALALFVAVPLPFTGAWTGSIAAYLLGLSKKETFFYVGLGVVAAGIIVTILTLLGIKLV